MNHTGPACTLSAFQPEPSVPLLLDWQSRSTAPAAPAGVLPAPAPLAAVPLADPEGIPRVARGTAIAAAATAARQAAPTRRRWRRCRLRTPSSNPAGAG